MAIFNPSSLSLLAAAVGGLLNATYGNAPELSIGFVALRSGYTDMVRASLIGAILANLLLGLGLAFLLGGLRHHVQEFNPAAARMQAGMMFMAVICLMVPGGYHTLSEILVGAVEGASACLGMSKSFVGLMVLAIVGGAAELGAAVTMGRRDWMDLAMGIAFGSSIQIALYVAPALVLLSYVAAPVPFTLVFTRGELSLLFMSVLIGAIVAGDGKSNWYKGVQLLTVYLIFAILFFLMPGK